MGALAVDRDHVVRFRARAMHLGHPAPTFEAATWGGLQDSAPRAGLLSLNARATGVTPDSWEHPSLVQVWGPRLAVYIVPRGDLGVFTLGRMPRDGAKRDGIDRMADEIVRSLNDEERAARAVAELIPQTRAVDLRRAGASGKVLVRWDASRSALLAADPPDMDPEHARVELARRFVRWLGPGTRAEFARWAGIEPSDAKQTWSMLEPELMPVDRDGTNAWIHEADVAPLSDAEPVTGVRLLPSGDPFLASARELIEPDEHKRAQLWPVPKTNPRLPDGKPYLPGAILAGDEIVGVWARTGARVTLLPWDRLAPWTREQIEREAEAISGPLGKAIRLDWA